MMKNTSQTATQSTPMLKSRFLQKISDKAAQKEDLKIKVPSKNVHGAGDDLSGEQSYGHWLGPNAQRQ